MVSKGVAIGSGIALAIAIIIGVFLFQQYEQREAIKNLQISLGGFDVKSIGFTSLTLGLDLNLYNPGSITATLDRIVYDVYANGNHLTNGEIPQRYDILPGQTVTVPTDITVSYVGGLETLWSAIKNGAVTWEVKGTDYFDMPIFGIVDLPFDVTKTSQYSGNSNPSITSNQGNSNPIPPLSTISGNLIVNSVYKVNPSSYTYIPINLQCTASVVGSFSAEATLGDNILVYVVDKNNFNNFQNSQSAQSYYDSGKVPAGSFNLNLQSGVYYIILSNTYSAISTKTVSITASYTCS